MNGGARGVLQVADFYMAHPGAGAFEQARRVGQGGALVEAEIDPAFVRQQIGVAVEHLPRADAVGGGAVAEPHDLARVRVDGEDGGAQGLHHRTQGLLGHLQQLLVTS